MRIFRSLQVVLYYQTACQTHQLYHRRSLHCTVLWQLSLVHWSVNTKWRKQWIWQIFSKKSLLHILISFRNPVQVNISYVSAICSKYAYSHYNNCLTLTIHMFVWQKTDDVHKFSLQLKESLLAEFVNDDAITSEDKALVRNDMGNFWSRFGSGTTTYT